MSRLELAMLRALLEMWLEIDHSEDMNAQLGYWSRETIAGIIGDIIRRLGY